MTTRDVWAIVLAGGDGQRLRSWVTERFGRPRPKQYCTWVGTRSWLWGVRAFLEKPDADQARAAMASGALWNTMILAARVDTLWALGWRCFPEMMPLFERLSSAVGSGEESAVLETIYRLMPVRNFSSGLLQRVAASLVVVELDGVLWSDWGRPERILETLRRIGLADSAGTPSAEASPAG